MTSRIAKGFKNTYILLFDIDSDGEKSVSDLVPYMQQKYLLKPERTFVFLQEHEEIIRNAFLPFVKSEEHIVTAKQTKAPCAVLEQFRNWFQSVCAENCLLCYRSVGIVKHMQMLEKEGLIDASRALNFNSLRCNVADLDDVTPIALNPAPEQKSPRNAVPSPSKKKQVKSFVPSPEDEDTSPTLKHTYSSMSLEPPETKNDTTNPFGEMRPTLTLDHSNLLNEPEGMSFPVKNQRNNRKSLSPSKKLEPIRKNKKRKTQKTKSVREFSPEKTKLKNLGSSPKNSKTNLSQMRLPPLQNADQK